MFIDSFLRNVITCRVANLINTGRVTARTTIRRKPIMIGWMERTCRDAVLPLLDAGHDTVGTHVNVYHLAGTPMGMMVTFTAEVIGVEGRRINFKVEAWDEKEKCGEGTHERAIINVARFTAKMQGKLGAEGGV